MGSLSMIVHPGVRPYRQKGDKGVNGNVFYCPNEKVVEKSSFWLISFNRPKTFGFRPRSQNCPEDSNAENLRELLIKQDPW